LSATGGIQPVNGLLTFALGSLAAGASTSVTIVVTPTAIGNLTDTATTSMDQTDPTPPDNTLILPTTVYTLVAVPPAPDLALSASAPGSVTVENRVTYTLTVTNNGTGDATGVMLTDSLPPGVTFVSATGGVTPVNGVLTFGIGTLAAGGTASFTIVVTPTAAGTLQNQARVRMDQTDPTPADDSIARSTTVVPQVVDGPVVTSVQPLGAHGQTKALVLAFNQPLNPTKAQILGNYQIVPLGRPKRAIRIKAALYNAATQTVTLTLAQRLKPNRRFQLTVVGTGPSGVTDLSGNLLDGQKTGDPGSNFVMVASAANVMRTTTNQKTTR
jgi:uncharacterized repeat protein (TIGR01451 family)